MATKFKKGDKIKLKQKAPHEEPTAFKEWQDKAGSSTLTVSAVMGNSYGFVEFGDGDYPHYSYVNECFILVCEENMFEL